MHRFVATESVLAELTSSRRTGSLFVVSGPSGVGKTILCNLMVERIPGLVYSISHTTRPKRANEQPGREYFFTGREEFEENIRQGRFLEWAQVHGNLYGTSVDFVRHMTAQGTDVIMDIDVQGGRQVKQKLPDSTLIFIVPPSMGELKKRLLNRNTDRPEDIQSRMEAACREIDQSADYDYLIVNRVLEETAKVLESIIIAERYRIPHETDKNY